MPHFVRVAPDSLPSRIAAHGRVVVTHGLTPRVSIGCILVDDACFYTESELEQAAVEGKQEAKKLDGKGGLAVSGWSDQGSWRFVRRPNLPVT